jgi:molecular chaperone GrpE
MRDKETTPAGASENPSAGDNGETADGLVLERDKLQLEKTELQNVLLRHAAEFDNFRKRVDRERFEQIEYASMEALKQMLPVLDDFERALRTPCADAEYAKGIELIYQRFYETLKKLGLEPVEAAGQPFDPNVHHAIEMVEDRTKPDQTVVAELLRGYTYKGRLLRAAMVKVAVRKG